MLKKDEEQVKMEIDSQFLKPKSKRLADYLGYSHSEYSRENYFDMMKSKGLSNAEIELFEEEMCRFTFRKEGSLKKAQELMEEAKISIFGQNCAQQSGKSNWKGSKNSDVFSKENSLFNNLLNDIDFRFKETTLKQEFEDTKSFGKEDHLFVSKKQTNRKVTATFNSVSIKTKVEGETQKVTKQKEEVQEDPKRKNIRDYHKEDNLSTKSSNNNRSRIDKSDESVNKFFKKATNTSYLGMKTNPSRKLMIQKIKSSFMINFSRSKSISIVDRSNTVKEEQKRESEKDSAKMFQNKALEVSDLFNDSKLSNDSGFLFGDAFFEPKKNHHRSNTKSSLQISDALSDSQFMFADENDLISDNYVKNNRTFKLNELDKQIQLINDELLKQIKSQYFEEKIAFLYKELNIHLAESKLQQEVKKESIEEDLHQSIVLIQNMVNKLNESEIPIPQEEHFIQLLIANRMKCMERADHILRNRKKLKKIDPIFRLIEKEMKCTISLDFIKLVHSNPNKTNPCALKIQHCWHRFLRKKIDLKIKKANTWFRKRRRKR